MPLTVFYVALLGVGAGARAAAAAGAGLGAGQGVGEGEGDGAGAGGAAGSGAAAAGEPMEWGVPLQIFKVGTPAQIKAGHYALATTRTCSARCNVRTGMPCAHQLCVYLATNTHQLDEAVVHPFLKVRVAGAGGEEDGGVGEEAARKAPETLVEAGVVGAGAASDDDAPPEDPLAVRRGERYGNIMNACRPSRNVAGRIPLPTSTPWRVSRIYLRRCACTPSRNRWVGRQATARRPRWPRLGRTWGAGRATRSARNRRGTSECRPTSSSVDRSAVWVGGHPLFPS